MASSPLQRALLALLCLAAALAAGASLAGAASDTTPPALDRVALTPDRMVVGGSLRIGHRLSEPATLTVRVERLRRGRPPRRLGTATAPAPAGTGQTQLSGTKLRPGRHRVRVVAVDAAGNRSAARTARFRVIR